MAFEGTTPAEDAVIAAAVAKEKALSDTAVAVALATLTTKIDNLSQDMKDVKEALKRPHVEPEEFHACKEFCKGELENVHWEIHGRPGYGGGLDADLAALTTTVKHLQWLVGMLGACFTTGLVTLALTLVLHVVHVS